MRRVETRSQAGHEAAVQDYCTRAIREHMPALLAEAHPRLAAELRAMPAPPPIHAPLTVASWEAWRAWTDALRWVVLAHRDDGLRDVMDGRVCELARFDATERELLPAALESIVGHVEMLPRRASPDEADRSGDALCVPRSAVAGCDHARLCDARSRAL